MNRKIKINNKWYHNGDEVMVDNKVWRIIFIGADASALLQRSTKFLHRIIEKTITGSVQI